MTVPVVRRWTAADSGFCPFRRYPSLHGPLEKFAKDKPLYDFVLSSLGSSLAVAKCLIARGGFRRGVSEEAPFVASGPVLGAVLRGGRACLRCDRSLPSLRRLPLPCRLRWMLDYGNLCWRCQARRCGGSAGSPVLAFLAYSRQIVEQNRIFTLKLFFLQKGGPDD